MARHCAASTEVQADLSAWQGPCSRSGGHEDVLHDVFVGFASQAGQFELKGSLKGYLAVCVANRARNVNRYRRPASTRNG